MRCACVRELICLECRAEIAHRAAGGEPNGHTWTVYGLKAMWAAMDAAKAARNKAPEPAPVPVPEEDDGFGWSPEEDDGFGWSPT